MEGGWESEKRRAAHRLLEDLEIGYLDTDIIDVLLEFFARPKAFTKSSCSGRIVAMDEAFPWIKEETNIVFKKHGKITVTDLKKLLDTPIRRTLWLRVQGPIYHVYVYGFDEAEEVLAIARRAGFKHSGIISLSRTTLLVELRTGIEMSMPLKNGSSLLVEPDRVPLLVSIANKALDEAKKRNRRLKEALEKSRPQRLWDYLVEHPVLFQLSKKHGIIGYG